MPVCHLTIKPGIHSCILRDANEIFVDEKCSNKTYYVSRSFAKDLGYDLFF